MNTLHYTIARKLLVLLIILSATSGSTQTDIFWVGGSGDWDDQSKWFKDAAGLYTAGIIPGNNNVVRFTNQSSSTPDWTVTIPPGSFDVHSIIVETADDFLLLLDGGGTNQVDMNVYGDIVFLSSHRLEYSSNSPSSNIWKFQGANTHDVSTGNLDMWNIQLLHVNGIFNQLSNLEASAQIRMAGGNWNSNGHDINSEKLLFNENITKVFTTGSSNIYCDEWDSKLTYGSFTVVGFHKIYVQKFTGSPKQVNGQAFTFDDIYLLEYQDNPSGTSVVEHNNFECRSCEINNLIIEDTGETKLADRFTINGKFIVENSESIILFNGGNLRTSEVTFNGLVTTPSISGCEERTVFSNVHNDYSTFIRNSGTLTVKDARVNNIHAVGGATFNIDNSVLAGSSPGWISVNPPQALVYIWIGIQNANGNWDDPLNWKLDIGGSNGCIPSIVDDVYIDDNSLGNMRIQSPYNAECRNFIWTNEFSLELILDGQIYAESSLTVAGDFDLDPSATITPNQNHEIYYSASSNNYIQTNNVHLPEIWFTGELAEWELQSPLTSDRIIFEGGTFSTNNFDVETDLWSSIGEASKHYDFTGSHIKVNGEMKLSLNYLSNVTINSFESLIECEKLTSNITDLYDIQLNNANTLLLNNYPYEFNSLILNGSGQVSTQNDMTLNNLVFKADNSILGIDITDNFVINGGIESFASVSNIAHLKSKTSGVQAHISKDIGNICVSGNVGFTDINATLSGVFNAPNGVDYGNNNGIDYNDGAGSTTLFWIGGSGLWQIKSNWSKISGGCASSKNPNDALNLIFNNFGLYDNNETITVPITGSCGNLFFYNSASSLTLDMDFTLTPTSITVSNGDLSIIGKNLNVIGQTRIENGGFLSSDMINFTTGDLTTTSGLLVVRHGTKVTIK